MGRAMADRNQLPVLVMQLKVLPPCRVCLPVSRVCLPVSPTETHVVCVSLCLPASGSSTDRKRARMLYGRGRGCCHAVWRGREGLQKEATGCNRLLVFEVTRVASCFEDLLSGRVRGCSHGQRHTHCSRQRRTHCSRQPHSLPCCQDSMAGRNFFPGARRRISRRSKIRAPGARSKRRGLGYIQICSSSLKIRCHAVMQEGAGGQRQARVRHKTQPRI